MVREWASPRESSRLNGNTCTRQWWALIYASLIVILRTEPSINLVQLIRVFFCGLSLSYLHLDEILEIFLVVNPATCSLLYERSKRSYTCAHGRTRCLLYQESLSNGRCTNYVIARDYRLERPPPWRPRCAPRTVVKLPFPSSFHRNYRKVQTRKIFLLAPIVPCNSWLACVVAVLFNGTLEMACLLLEIDV